MQAAWHAHVKSMVHPTNASFLSCIAGMLIQTLGLYLLLLPAVSLNPPQRRKISSNRENTYKWLVVQ